MDAKPRGKPPKPLKLLASLFQRSRSRGKRRRDAASDNSADDDNRHAHDVFVLAGEQPQSLMLYSELEALHLSRQDNPYLQKVCSQENLIEEADRPRSRFGSQSCSRSLFSPDLNLSPTASCDPLSLAELHMHLVRSPPPVSWPTSARPMSPRSTGTFSPDSSDGLLEMESAPINYYTRSASEEHILSPRRERSSRTLSPERGATPDFLLLSTLTDPSSPRSKSIDPREAYSAMTNTQKVHRNCTLQVASYHEDVVSPLRQSTATFGDYSCEFH
jgi:hypothetical protein